MLRRLFVFISMAGLALAEPPPAAPPATPPVPTFPASVAQEQLAMLVQGNQAVARDRAALKEKEAKLESMKTGKGLPAKASQDEIDAMQKQVDDARTLVSRHEDDLKQALVGVTGLDDKDAGSEPEGDLSKDFKEVVQPLLRSAKDLVARQRRTSELHSEISRKQLLLTRYDQALLNLQKLSEVPTTKETSKDLRDLLTSERKELENNRAYLPVDISNLQRELAQLETERRPWLEYATTILRDSVLKRVWNLLLAMLAALGVLLLCRLVQRFVTRRGWMRKLGFSLFLLRLGNVVFYIFTAFSAGMAGFLVLYASDDWFLLTLAMLSLAGLVLASRHTLPKLYDEVKLLLNLGTAREGERIIYRDLPWLLRRINFFCEIVNPSLTGGTLRLSLKDVVPLKSRPFDRKERWFPTEEGDWVTLDDGMLGRVVLQSPEWVQLVPNGGSYKTYTTLEFLKKNPRNLSHNFRLTSTFGIAYKHAVAALEEIPRKLETRVRKELLAVLDPEEILNLAATLAHAGSSMLDMMILADIKGSAASKYNELERLLQRACVAEATENGWEIPYPQLTLHRER